VYFKHDEGAGSGPPAVETFVKATGAASDHLGSASTSQV
jgi:hypothetical protein